MTETLQSLKTELKRLNDLLALDLTNWDEKTKAGMQGSQNSARVRIEDVKASLAQYLLKNSATVLLMRDYEDTASVVESAKKNLDANIVLDSLMLEKKLFKQLFEEKATAFTFNTQIVNHLNVMLSEIGTKMGALSMNMVAADAKYYGTLKNRESMISRLEAVLYDTYGDELKRLFFGSLLADEIMKRTHRDTVNVVIVNVLPNMVRAFSSFTGNTQVLSNNTTEVAVPVQKRTQTKPTPTQSTKSAGPVVNQIQPSQVEGNRAYTGKKRGRKTDAERAARMSQQAVEKMGTETSTDNENT